MKLSFRSKILIVVGSIISLAAILLPIIFYYHDFHKLSRSRHPSDWGSFGDFFGGILNPIISLLTLLVTIAIAVYLSDLEKRNHDESVHSPVKPFFTIDADEFYSADTSQLGAHVLEDFYSYERPQAPAGMHDYFNQPLSLKLFNRGLGTATEVSIKFEINIIALQKVLQHDNGQLKIATSKIWKQESRAGVTANFNSIAGGKNGSVAIHANETFRLGYIEKDKQAEAYVPAGMIDAFKLYNQIRKFDIPILPFPDIWIELTYKNIHGRELKAKFEIALVYKGDFNTYSVFRLFHRTI